MHESPSAELLEQIAAAVLYEGSVLWPYRRSARKNQQRWTFGGVYPRGFVERAASGDAWRAQAQCLVVRLHPRGRADVFDLALDGKIATVESIEQDYDERVHLAVVLVDDPGRDLDQAQDRGRVHVPRHARLAQALGGRPPRVLVVGCEPATVDLDEDGQIGLSPAVEAAVDEAVHMIESLVIDLEGVAHEGSRRWDNRDGRDDRGVRSLPGHPIQSGDPPLYEDQQHVMHEAALAQGILDVVLDVADGRPVWTVRVRAGELLAVSEDSLQFCFELVAQDTLAAGARLEVQMTDDDALLVDGVELDDGWRWRPDAVHDEVVT